MDKRSIDEIPVPCLEAEVLHDALREWRYACDTRYGLQKRAPEYTAMYERHLALVDEVRNGVLVRCNVVEYPHRPEGRLSRKKLVDYAKRINKYLAYNGCKLFCEVQNNYEYYQVADLSCGHEFDTDAYTECPHCGWPEDHVEFEEEES